MNKPLPTWRLRAVTAVNSVLLVLGTLAMPLAHAQREEGIFDTISDWFTPEPAAASEADRRGATPSHVFRAVQDLIAEIRILRDELGVYDYPPMAELQEDRMPVHVYAKSLELLAKVTRIQRRFGVPAGQVGQIPFKEVVPGDVLGNVEYITDELRKVKAQMVIERAIEPSPLVGGKTPSVVYKSLADASFMLDGLRGRPLAPDDVFQNASYILDEMELIAARMRVPLNLDFPAIEESKTPTDVAQQVLRATYKVINLQSRLGMDASGVPTLTLVRVTPSEVYDATNMLLAEMARIKFHLDINVPRDPSPEPKGKQPRDVFQLVLVIIQNLDAMIAQAAVS